MQWQHTLHATLMKRRAIALLQPKANIEGDNMGTEAECAAAGNRVANERTRHDDHRKTECAAVPNAVQEFRAEDACQNDERALLVLKVHLLQATLAESAQALRQLEIETMAIADLQSRSAFWSRTEALWRTVVADDAERTNSPVLRVRRGSRRRSLLLYKRRSAVDR